MALSETRTEIGPGKTSFFLKRPSPDSAKGPKRRLELPLSTPHASNPQNGVGKHYPSSNQENKTVVLIGKSVITIYRGPT